MEEAIIEEKEAVKEKEVIEVTPNETNVASEKDSSKNKASEEEEGEDEEEVASSEDEEHEEEEHEEKAQKDYSTLSEKELVAELDKLLKTKKIRS